MSDFSQPESATYVALCRELKLERTPDVFDQFGFAYRGEYKEVVSFGMLSEWHRNQEWWWLPSLSDWLEMLAREGWSVVKFMPINGWMIQANTQGDELELGSAPTREEAAARLWVAVKRHPPIALEALGA